MKMILLISAFLFSVLGSHAQVYIGKTEKEVRSFVKPNEICKTFIMPDGVRCVMIRYKESAYYNRSYYFKKDTCFLYILEPLTQEAYQKLVAKCDKEYEASVEPNEKGIWYTRICLSPSGNTCLLQEEVKVAERKVVSLPIHEFFFTVAN